MSNNGGFINIPIEQFTFYDKKIIDKLYDETDPKSLSSVDYLNLPVTEAYKNNKERIEREEREKKEKEVETVEGEKAAEKTA